MFADLPPSSRNTFFTVAEARAMMCLPTAVEPVNDTMSTRGSPTSWSPTSRGSSEVITLNTPAGISVCSFTRRPSIVADHGVSGAALSTTVQPAASAGMHLARLICSGTFQGVMQATTPIASFSTRRRLFSVPNALTPMSRLHWNFGNDSSV